MSSRGSSDLEETVRNETEPRQRGINLHREHGKAVILGVNRKRSASHYTNRGSTCGVAAQNNEFASVSQKMHIGLHACSSELLAGQEFNQ